MCLKVDIKEVYMSALNSFLAGETSGEELKRQGRSEDETGNEKEGAEREQQIDRKGG